MSTSMGDDICTEEELLAHAIALSLETQATPRAAGRTPETSTPQTDIHVPLRSDTVQSYDSVLNEPEMSPNESLRLRTQCSQGRVSSLRSSPDLGLGIAPEGDIDPQSGMLGVKREEGFEKSSRESLLSSPEDERVQATGLRNITLDGGDVVSASGKSSRQNPVGEESQHLPFTRLSSLHDMNLGRQASADRGWRPNKEALEQIVGMGISENAAKRALYNTGNNNAQMAIGWVFENIGNLDLHEPFTPPMMPSSQDSESSFGDVYYSYDDMIESDQEARLKMVFVVNTNLKMGVGKIAAQVGHAVLGMYHCLESQRQQKSEVLEWENRGSKKVVLKGVDAQHLLDLKQKATELLIGNVLIQDAGRTQVDPGSLTVLALFGRSKDVDNVTGKLKLL